MEMTSRDYTTQLFRLATPLFLFLVSFRRKVQQGLPGQRDDGGERARGDLRAHGARGALTTRASTRCTRRPSTRWSCWPTRCCCPASGSTPQAWQSDHLLEEKYFQTQHRRRQDLPDRLRAALRGRGDGGRSCSPPSRLGVRGTYHRKPEKLAEIKAKLYRQLARVPGRRPEARSPRTPTTSTPKQGRKGLAGRHPGPDRHRRRSASSSSTS